MSKHPSWVELMARPMDAEVAHHVQHCPQCRVDRRRLLVEWPDRGALPAAARRRLEKTHERVVRELLPSVRTASSSLPRQVRRDRLPPAGTPFGPYRAVGVLGRGETSLVLLAVHERHGTRHALKVVRTRDPAVQEQVRREHHMQGELHHPLLLPVLDSVDTPTGQAVLVLEFVDGPSLARLLRNRAFLPWSWIDAIAIDLLRGVDALHEAGWVHRDLNPGNVMLDPNPRFRARVGDFGQTTLRGSEAVAPVATMPLYAAPEQLEPGRRADAKGDVFALGSLLYELVTHQRCFAGLDSDDVTRRVREVEHIPVGELRPDTPARIAEAIEAALTADLEARPARAAELLDLWTRGAGEAARPDVDLTGVERAALRSMRGIERLPAARSAFTPTTVPEPTGTIPALTRAQIEEQAYARPTLPRWLRNGRWAAMLGGIGLVAIIGFATRTAMQPVVGPPPTEVSLDRGRTGIVDPDLARNHRTLVYSDGQDLWVGPLDGSTPWVLTGAFSPAATEPTWSRDQSSVAFTGPDGIYTVDLRRGDDPVPAVPWAHHPTWSPDGSRIVFVARPRDDQPVALRVWDRWTLEVVTLLEEPGLGRPTFSPDGTRIAIETGRGLEMLGVRLDEEGRLEVTDRRPLAPGDTAPTWLGPRVVAAFRADGTGGAVVRWDEADGAWTDRVILETPHDVRTFEVGEEARWFVLGLTEAAPSILRIRRDGYGPPEPAADGRDPRIAPDGGLAYLLPDDSLRWVRPDGEVRTVVTESPFAHWGFTPEGLVFRGPLDGADASEWVVVDQSSPRVSAQLGGLPLEGPFAASSDGRYFAGHLDDGGPVLLDLEEPIEPQLEAAEVAPWPGDRVVDLSPDGSWLLVGIDDAYGIVDRLTGDRVGPVIPGLSARFADDGTLVVARPDEVVIVDRRDGETLERYPLHPYAIAAVPGVTASNEDIFVDGIVERGGLIRVDRLDGPAR